MKSGECFARLMVAGPGKKFSTRMKTLEQSRWLSILRTHRRFTPICGLAGRVPGKMDRGKVRRAAYTNRPTVERVGENSRRDYLLSNKDSAALVSRSRR